MVLKSNKNSNKNNLPFRQFFAVESTTIANDFQIIIQFTHCTIALSDVCETGNHIFMGPNVTK